MAKRKTNSEHQLKPSLLSLQKKKEEKGFLRVLESLWSLLIPVFRFNKGQLCIMTLTGRRGQRKSRILSSKKAMFCYIPDCGWIVQPASKWNDYENMFTTRRIGSFCEPICCRFDNIGLKRNTSAAGLC
jgi:hypothetical protein